MQVVERIHPGDTMINRKQPEGYFLIGQSGLECVQAFIGDEQPRTILDLPCGHGRVLRYLLAAYPDAAVTACDIDREGVDFCAELGATPLYSSENPADIEAGHFDLIWCGSLLTHFDAPRWRPWLEFFVEHLNPGGSVVFTTHGRHYARGRVMTFMPPSFPELQADYERTGFAFDPKWDVSLSSPAWVFGLLPDLDVRFVERGWHGLQDAWCLTAP